MPELPEIVSRAREMDVELHGKQITAIEVIQPKSLNMPVQEFQAALTGATLKGTYARGKWIITETSQGYLLLNLGMGGEILLVTRATLPPKRRLVFDFSDQTSLAINFWWFGYAHFAAHGELHQHPMIGKLGLSPLELDSSSLRNLIQGKRGTIKSFLLDQSQVAGIGNAYIHDILFLARLHPLRPLNSLKDAEITGLVQAFRAGLLPSLEKGGAFYEVNLQGQKGGFQVGDILIGYREGQPCPACGEIIIKIKTGSTSSYICPACQRL
ncbi:MAG TPA: DNA-formamidopyrimidine glycosylase family protein [Anaerolineaceae bacterium]